MEILQTIGETIYFFLPAGFANMAPVLFQWLPWLASPIDRGKTFRGKIIFGDHKTRRGLVMGLLLGTTVAYIQSFYPLQSFPENWIVIGFLQSVGALLGDLVKSFCKRQRGILPGKPWVPFDQLDFIIGAIITVSLFFSLPVKLIITALILAPFFHITINRIGFWLKIRQTPW